VAPVRADAYPIEKIFDTAIQYRVPLFQRPYVWELNVEDPSEDRLTPFWEDVRDTVARYLKRQEHMAQGVPEDELAAFTDHFFGAVVLGKLDKSFGGIPHQEVIDGQQRFTTAQLLIAAAQRLAEAHGYATTAEALRDLRLNAEKHDPKPHERHKLWPTNVNRAAYEAVMDPGGLQQVPDDPNNRIQEAYTFFAGELGEWIEDVEVGAREKYVKALHRVLRAHLKFVVIELEEGDNAQEIFESLNAQGTPLLAIDLVKNHVFRRADIAKVDLDELDTTVWRELDAKWWREEQRQGRFRRPRAELFLMHWLTVRKRDEVPALGLFVEFQREIIPVEDAQLRDFVEGFIDDAKLYRSFESQPDGSVPKRFFDRLNLLDTTTLYPVVLRLFMAERDGQLTATERDDALRAMESWVVRRMICDYTAKNYNRTAIELLKRIDAASEAPHVPIIRFLRDATLDTELWPDDPLVRKTLEERPLYNRLKPVRRVRLLLEACELERRLASGGYAEIKDQDAPQLGIWLTVEHVLPQQWRSHWPVDADPGASDEVRYELEAERDAHVHRVGNLTLVTKKLNPSVGNAVWSSKRDALDTHSILHLNRDLVTDHPDDWSEPEIDSRGAFLAELITSHWQGPEVWTDL
jgi:hypothetical protein